jgi:hypothetical protein
MKYGKRIAVICTVLVMFTTGCKAVTNNGTQETVENTETKYIREDIMEFILACT